MLIWSGDKNYVGLYTRRIDVIREGPYIKNLRREDSQGKPPFSTIAEFKIGMKVGLVTIMYPLGVLTS